MSKHIKTESLAGITLGNVWLQPNEESRRRKAHLEEVPESVSRYQLRLRYRPDDATPRFLSKATARRWFERGILTSR